MLIEIAAQPALGGQAVGNAELAMEQIATEQKVNG